MVFSFSRAIGDDEDNLLRKRFNPPPADVRFRDPFSFRRATKILRRFMANYHTRPALSSFFSRNPFLDEEVPMAEEEKAGLRRENPSAGVSAGLKKEKRALLPGGAKG